MQLSQSGCEPCRNSHCTHQSLVVQSIIGLPWKFSHSQTGQPSYTCSSLHVISLCIILCFTCMQLCWTCQCSQVQQKFWASVRQPTRHPAACLSDSTSSPGGLPTTLLQIDLSLPQLIKFQVTKCWPESAWYTHSSALAHALLQRSINTCFYTLSFHGFKCRRIIIK